MTTVSLAQLEQSVGALIGRLRTEMREQTGYISPTETHRKPTATPTPSPLLSLTLTEPEADLIALKALEQRNQRVIKAYQSAWAQLAPLPLSEAEHSLAKGLALAHFATLLYADAGIFATPTEPVNELYREYLETAGEAFERWIRSWRLIISFPDILEKASFWSALLATIGENYFQRYLVYFSLGSFAAAFLCLRDLNQLLSAYPEQTALHTKYPAESISKKLAHIQSRLEKELVYY